MDEEALGRRRPLAVAVGERLERAARPCPAPRRSPPGTATARPTAASRSARYAHVTSTASSDGGPAGRSAARGKSDDGPYCIEPRTRPSSSRYTVPHAPHSSSARSIHLRFSGSRLPRVCHQTHVWQTVGAVSSVAPVSPASRDVIASREACRRARRRRPRTRLRHSPCARGTRRRALVPDVPPHPALAPHSSSRCTTTSAFSADSRPRRRPASDPRRLHLQRRIARIPGEHIGRDDGRLHHADRTTSSVTSGRAKSRNGTNVVPRPGDTCSFVAP